jgi:hypothetical protein
VVGAGGGVVVVVVGAGTTAHACSPGFTMLNRSRAMRSISLSLSSRFDSSASFRVCSFSSDSRSFASLSLPRLGGLDPACAGMTPC